MSLFGARVYVHGRLRGLTQRRVADLAAAAGGSITRRAASASLIVLGHSSAKSTLADTGEITLSFRPTDKALIISERHFRRQAGLAAQAPAGEGTYSSEQIERLAGLTASRLRGLALYDVFDPVDGRYAYRDLVVARMAARLLAGGAKLGNIALAALALEERGANLSGVRLSEAPWGEILQEIDGRLARLDGQLFLPMQGEDIGADDAFARAEASEAGGDLASARRWYELAARLDRKDGVISFNLGNVLDAQGLPREAEIAYRQAIARSPELADAWFNLGVLQEKQGRTEEALDSYEQAYLVEPAYADALHNAGLVLMRLKRFEAALRLWDRVIAIAPSAADAKRLAHLCRLEIANSVARPASDRISSG